MTNTDTNAFIEILRQQLTNAPEGVDTSALAAAIDALANPEEQRVKIWFLLDRSGSMQHLAGDVIGGFNQFLADQATKPGKVRMTAVQFDGQDPFEVIYDAQHVAAIPPPTNTTYWARGVTPLYDAVGTLIERADARLVKRAKDGCPLEDQLVLVFTDGLENASHRFERAQVFEMIKNRMDNDWTFVFMGANQDSYAEGGKIGLATGNVQDYAATPESVGAAFGSMSRATGEFRGKSRPQRVADKEQFFGGLKEAEEALRRKKNN